jgi:MraZ protein
MDRFVSTFTNRIDAKGRLSIPAPFRAVLERDRYTGAATLGLYCYPSLDAPALDAGGEKLAQKIDGLLGGLPDYSDERDELAVALYGEAQFIAIDADGRIVLPKELRTIIGLPEGVAEVAFVGLGDKFQVWSPDRFQERRARAREKVREHRRLLGTAQRPPSASGDDGDGGRET